jgi:hypothetical protein
VERGPDDASLLDEQPIKPTSRAKQVTMLSYERSVFFPGPPMPPTIRRTPYGKDPRRV